MGKGPRIDEKGNFMKRFFDEELTKMKNKVLEMALLVEQSISDSSEALFRRENERANQVIKNDQEINLYEIELDELGHELIALHQPAAVDLRFITMVLKITNDLERMGDQSVNIAQKALIINQEPQFKPYRDLPQMAKLVLEMTRGAIKAFVEGDPELAKKILESDDEVDSINRQISLEIQSLLEKNPNFIKTGFSLIMVAHNLERIADLATNIAEDVIYVNRGIDVRHHIRERRK